MFTLALDTSASTLSVALLDDEKTIAKHTIYESGKQAELLIPQIEKVLQEAKIWYEDLGLIAATNGPGSFTGTRIGLTAARTIKLATNLPLVLVNSCEVIAFKYRNRNSKIFTMLDAAMDEFFGAEFFAENEKLIPIQEPRIIRQEELSQFLPKENFFLCGSGKNLIKQQNFNAEINDEKDEIEADLVGLLALTKFRENNKSSDDLNPFYLRAPRITERKK